MEAQTSTAEARMRHDGVVPPGTRRLLALDGGGIRGLIALEVLSRLESDLRERYGRHDLVLADVFDYIGGTSTGAIIAAGLALGFETQRLLRLYVDHAEAMFDRSRWHRRHRSLYDDDRLASILQAEMGPDTTLGSDRLRTLLLLVLRNASTDSPWPVTNNPAARYNDPELPECNLRLPLWQLVRASTAAPIYFPPETVRIGSVDHVFVDGAVTPFNNPSFQLVLMATAPSYRLGWPLGSDRLLLVSVGTGAAEHHRPELAAEDLHLVNQVAGSISGLMTATSAQQDLLCRMLGDCRAGQPLDSEVGDLRGGDERWVEPLFSYLRYDRPISRESLDALGLADVEPRSVLPIDGVDQIETLRRVGTAVAADAVDLSHFEGFLA